MPQFAIVHTDEQLISLANVADYREALKLAGLKSGEIDFGIFGQSHGNTFEAIVYQFGLIKPRQTTYFRCGKHLFNGNTVLCKNDIEGNTVDFPTEIVSHWLFEGCPEFEWFKNSSEVEEAIKSGRVDRPQQIINGIITWEWNKGIVK